MRITVFCLLMGLGVLLPVVMVQADELVVNGDTGVDTRLIQDRVDLAGAASFAPKSRDSGFQTGQGSTHVMRFSPRKANTAEALANIAPAAGNETAPRAQSDGGALASFPLTDAEQFARKRIEMRPRP